MRAQLLQGELAVIRDRKFFLIVADEGTDISNKGLLSFCFRTVSDNLNVGKNFLGFYKIGNIKSETIFDAIKDILLRYCLSLHDRRAQMTDGTSNMMGKHTRVSNKIRAEQTKAVATNFQGH